MALIFVNENKKIAMQIIYKNKYIYMNFSYICFKAMFYEVLKDKK